MPKPESGLWDDEPFLFGPTRLVPSSTPAQTWKLRQSPRQESAIGDVAAAGGGLGCRGEGSARCSAARTRVVRAADVTGSRSTYGRRPNLPEPAFSGGSTG